MDISEQHMYVYEGDQLLYSFVASTGINNGTRTGLFHVQSKIPNAYGAHVEYLDAQLARHLLVRAGWRTASTPCPFCPMGQGCGPGILRRPISYGCVVLGSYEASLLYNWAEIGTPVEIWW